PPAQPLLRWAAFRVAGTAREPSPSALPADNVLSAENDAELVRIDAQLLGVVTGPSERVLVLRSRTGDAAFEAALDRSRDGESLAAMRPGSLVTVTGVYSYQAGPPPSFPVSPRSPAAV